MEYRFLGRSGLKVSCLTFGTMTFGGEGMFKSFGSADIDHGRRQLDMCLDAGINLVDTANAYGRSEDVLGEIVGERRNRLLLATKVRYPVSTDPNGRGLSRHHVIEQCEASLRRMRTDHIDLFQLHGWDGQTPVQETLEALDMLVRAGKVRYVGVSNFSGWHLMKTIGVAELHRLIRPVSQQIYYTLASREAEFELVPLGIDQGVGILVWSPLAGGRLTGKYRADQADTADTRGGAVGWDNWPVSNPQALHAIVDLLVRIGKAHHVSAAQVALAWLLGRPGVASLVVGARTEAQLADNLSAVGLRLLDEERRELDRASAPPLIYPYWHQATGVSDRFSPADRTMIDGRGDDWE